MLKNRRRTCVDRLSVSTSQGAFEPSRLDDEQPSGPAEMTTGPAPLRPPLLRPPDITHVIPGLPRFSPPFRIRVLLSTETEEQKKRGRPGNEACTMVSCSLCSLGMYHICCFRAEEFAPTEDEKWYVQSDLWKD